MWPIVARVGRGAEGPPRRPRDYGREAHDWRWGATAATSTRVGYRCARCLRMRQSTVEGKTTFVRARSACAGASEVLRRAARQELGHTLVTAALPDGGQLIYCLRRGGMGVELLRMLASECAPGPAAHQPFRKAVLAGKHPKSKLPLGPLRRVANCGAIDGG